VCMDGVMDIAEQLSVQRFDKWGRQPVGYKYTTTESDTFHE